MIILISAKERCCYELEFEFEEGVEVDMDHSEQVFYVAKDLLDDATIEWLPMADESMVMLVDEDGRIKELPFNPVASELLGFGINIVGDAIVAGLDYNGDLEEFKQNPIKHLARRKE